MIDSKDISVILQGPVDYKITPLSIKSIRRYLPGAEIILSTWKGSDTSNLEYDKLILSDDPGAVQYWYCYQSIHINNINRQLISSKNGAQAATRDFILKLRSDLILRNANFLQYFDMRFPTNSDYLFFSHRVICSSVYSREFSNETGLPTPFHPSDFWLFGFSKDIISYFSAAKLMTPDELGNWSFKFPNRIPCPTMLWRYAPEQYFCLCWLKQYINDIEFYDWSDWNNELIKISNRILYNNFIFIGFRESGIFCNKHKYAFKNDNTIPGIITYKHFLKRVHSTYIDNYILKDDDYYLDNRFTTSIRRVGKPFKIISKIFVYPAKYIYSCIYLIYFYIKKFIK